jgi:photosystem I subunit 3
MIFFIILINIIHITVMKRHNLTNLLFIFLIINNPLITFANDYGLTKCSESLAFNARLKSSIKRLEQRVNKYEVNSSPALALKQQIARTEARFNKYSQSNLYCGNDGLPHLIVDGRWDHASEFIIPSLGFIYISGWIGWVARRYLQTISTNKNPAQDEIMINIPLALKVISTGYIWPILIWREFSNGNLIASKDTITVSPR